MELTCVLPINRTSLGNVSYGLLREIYKRGYDTFYFPIGQIDYAVFKQDLEFQKWVEDCYQKAIFKHNRERPALKLWHLFAQDDRGNLTGSYQSYSKNTTFISFYELDSPTPLELNVAKSFDTVFTSKYTCEVFANNGANTRYVPLFFDDIHYHVTNKKYYSDDRIAFFIYGKYENRKNHAKAIGAWAKRFGNNKRFYLNLAVYNNFFPANINQQLISAALNNQYYWNINNIGFVPTNAAFNDLLNANHIGISASGGEGFDLIGFHMAALGKHLIALNAHVYKDWCDDNNAILFPPLCKKSAVDGVFFREKSPCNQGQIFDWDEDEFINACEKAVQRYESNPVNEAGKLLQKRFSVENTLNGLLFKTLTF